jgi:hypothetical protein
VADDQNMIWITLQGSTKTSFQKHKNLRLPYAHMLIRERQKNTAY